jgi:hypothetical protein
MDNRKTLLPILLIAGNTLLGYLPSLLGAALLPGMTLVTTICSIVSLCFHLTMFLTTAIHTPLKKYNPHLNRAQLILQLMYVFLTLLWVLPDNGKLTADQLYERCITASLDQSQDQACYTLFLINVLTRLVIPQIFNIVAFSLYIAHCRTLFFESHAKVDLARTWPRWVYRRAVVALVFQIAFYYVMNLQYLLLFSPPAMIVSFFAGFAAVALSSRLQNWAKDVDAPFYRDNAFVIRTMVLVHFCTSILVPTFFLTIMLSWVIAGTSFIATVLYVVISGNLVRHLAQKAMESSSQ